MNITTFKETPPQTCITSQEHTHVRLYINQLNLQKFQINGQSFKATAAPPPLPNSYRGEKAIPAGAERALWCPKGEPTPQYPESALALVEDMIVVYTRKVVTVDEVCVSYNAGRESE